MEKLKAQFINKLEELASTKENYKYLTYRIEDHKVVVGTEETIYDYDFEPADLMEILEDYSWEWYNSVEIEVYFG